MDEKDVVLLRSRSRRFQQMQRPEEGASSRFKGWSRLKADHVESRECREPGRSCLLCSHRQELRCILKTVGHRWGLQETERQGECKNKVEDGVQGRNPGRVLEVEPRGAGDFVWMMSIPGPWTHHSISFSDQTSLYKASCPSPCVS